VWRKALSLHRDWTSRPPCAFSCAATPAMIDDSELSFSLPSVLRKKVTAVFDGGRLSSDSGVMLLALVKRRRNVAAMLAALIADRRDPSHIRHTVADVLRARMLAIGCAIPWQRLRLVAPRPRFQAGVWPPARQRPGSVLAADHLALGECADGPRDHSPHLQAFPGTAKRKSTSHNQYSNPRSVTDLG
jgi:hypothetical protein